jgi:RNA polymerase sigma-70 factor (ECF subfamily)
VDADSILVGQAASGSAEAFEELVRRYERPIVNLARALGAADSAEDVAQECFIRAFRGLRRFRGDSSFRTWLYRIAINVTRSQLHSEGRWRRPWSRSLDPAGGNPPVEAAQPGFEDAWLRRDAIDRALAGIPLDLRTAVVLRDLQGLEYREIATALGVPIGTVESRIYRGRQMLKPLLAALAGRAAGQVAPTRRRAGPGGREGPDGGGPGDGGSHDLR